MVDIKIHRINQANRVIDDMLSHRSTKPIW